jgi:hypothetical protein
VLLRPASTWQGRADRRWTAGGPPHGRAGVTDGTGDLNPAAGWQDPLAGADQARIRSVSTRSSSQARNARHACRKTLACRSPRGRRGWRPPPRRARPGCRDGRSRRSRHPGPGPLTGCLPDELPQPPGRWRRADERPGGELVAGGRRDGHHPAAAFTVQPAVVPAGLLASLLVSTGLTGVSPARERGRGGALRAGRSAPGRPRRGPGKAGRGRAAGGR